MGEGALSEEEREVEYICGQNPKSPKGEVKFLGELRVTKATYMLNISFCMFFYFREHHCFRMNCNNDPTSRLQSARAADTGERGFYIDWKAASPSKRKDAKQQAHCGICPAGLLILCTNLYTFILRSTIVVVYRRLQFRIRIGLQFRIRIYTYISKFCKFH